MSPTSIACSTLSFSWPGETPLFERLSFAVGSGRTGLVAPNGAGKSTLLKLIAGEYRPTDGSVSVDGVIGYLPQTLPFDGRRTVAEVLGVAPVLDALNALACGDAGEDVFTAIGDDWDIEERTRAQLDRLGLCGVALDRTLDSLSGGEVVSLGLAAELLKRPDILLLDEPTNNLDADARAALYKVLDDFKGCLLLVSHDRTLLDRMDRIAELHRGEIVLYGGDFTAYEESVREAQRVAESTVRNVEQQLRREKRQRQQARERAARRSSLAARTIKDAGLPKIVAGAMKRRAQESAGRIDGVNAARVEDARARLDDAERALRDDTSIALELPDTEVPAGRKMFVGSGLQVRRGDRALFGNGYDIAIRGPERIALTGPNGAGKTTLLRVISGELQPDAGTIARAYGRIGYLSQRLDLLDPAMTVLESLIAYAPELTETRRMHLLAQFLFHGNRIHVPISALSGGERLRATLACVLYAQPAPQLLLLDEPTNNLDLVSVGQLESALTAYRGALVVVSHDARFLDNLGITREIAFQHAATNRTSSAGTPFRDDA
jgi:ATPase subunit of ABC transporter with duplicated ATPase domains